MSRKKVEGFAERIRSIREALRPGTTLRSFGRLMKIEGTYVGWESKGHAPGEPRLTDELSKLVPREQAADLSRWAHDGRGSMPLRPVNPDDAADPRGPIVRAELAETLVSVIKVLTVAEHTNGPDVTELVQSARGQLIGMLGRVAPLFLVRGQASTAA